MNRREAELIERGVKALERLAGANEEIIKIANEEKFTVEEGSSTCPYCGKLNPEVTQLGSGGSGPVSEFVLVAETHCCNRTVYCVPVSIQILPNEAMQQLQKGGNENGSTR
jgi:hypothetical protein